MSSYDLDPDALAAVKARFATLRAERDAAPAAKPRQKKSAKLAQRARREADAINYGDGRRSRTRGAGTVLVQLNAKVPADVKALVQARAQKDGEDMAAVIIKAVYRYEDYRADEDSTV